ncbi:MAG: peroxidase family protein [Candidatus Nitrotoga sp.]
MPTHSNFKINVSGTTPASDPTVFNSSKILELPGGGVTKNPTKRNQAKRKVDELELNEAEIKSSEEVLQVAQAETATGIAATESVATSGAGTTTAMSAVFTDLLIDPVVAGAVGVGVGAVVVSGGNANVFNAPFITSGGGGAVATINVAENIVTVATVTATDPNGTVLSYSIAGGADAAKFVIDRNTGAISFIAAPDFENPADAGANNVYDVTVQATDGLNIDTQAISIIVTNVNDTSPVITSNGAGVNAVITIVEMGNPVITTVTATDADNINTALSYRIVGGIDKDDFGITSAGTLRFFSAAPPDFETPWDADKNNVYNIIVEVSDGLNVDTQAIAIAVININDNPPVITSNITSNDGGATAEVTVGNGATVATTITATDADINAIMAYSIVGGTDQNKFQIVSNAALNNAVLNFITPPIFASPTDSNGNNTYLVDVQVSDGTFTDTQSITVIVSQAPAITSNGGGATAAITILENSTAVTTVTSTSTPPIGISFSIIGGADAAKFEINVNTGELKFKMGAVPDFERPTFIGNGAYEVTVQAQSGVLGGGGLTDTQTIAVTVANVAEVPLANSAPMLKLDVTDLVFLENQAGAIIPGFVGVGALAPQDPLQITNPLYLAQTTGIRTFSGVNNNLVPGQSNFGAADQPFARLLTPVNSRAAEVIPAGLPPFGQASAGTPTAYNNGNVLNPDNSVAISGRFIVDSTPREISNLVSFEDKFNDNTPIPDAVNPLPFSAAMTLFGQFFDHGLDLIPKGGMGTVFMPLLPSDPLYNDPRGINPDGTFNNFQTLTRASYTVVDPVTRATLLPTDPGYANGERVYPNIVTPFIDQNQTYGSHAGMTVFLREYHDTLSAIQANGVAIGLRYDAGIAAAIADPATSPNLAAALAGVKGAVDAAITNTIAGFTIATTVPDAIAAIHTAVVAAINTNANAGAIFTALGIAPLDTSFNPPTYFVFTGDPTGRLVSHKNTDGSDGGMATWADIKANALKIGITLTDADVLNLPKVYLYPDGAVENVAFVNGIPNPAYAGGTYQRMTDGKAGLVIKDGFIDGSGNPVAPLVLLSNGTYLGDLVAHGFAAGDTPTTPLRINHALLDDIANGASPRSRTGAALIPDADVLAGGAPPAPDQYDDELLNAHFIAGDGRVNENFGLTSIHSVFSAEHNRVVAELRALDAANGIERTGEQIFQAAKLVVEMEYQDIVFDEFARLISPNITEFAGYDVSINPAITLEFSQAVYRFGHSMLTETVDLIDASGNLTQVGLIQAFLNPLAFANADGTANGLTTFTELPTLPGLPVSVVDTGSRAFATQVITGMSHQVGSEIDELITPALRNNLLGLPLDLASLNIARGRDVGLPSLNEARAQFFEATGGNASLKPYVSWEDFGNNLLHPKSLQNFIMAYAAADLQAWQTGPVLPTDPQPLTAQQWIDYRVSTNVIEQNAYALALSTAAKNAMDNPAFMGVGGNQKFWDIDLWLGGLAEKKVFMGMLGSTFDFVFATQMTALQDGDRLYYLNRLNGTNLLTEVEGQSFADLVMRNTDAKHLYARAFLVADAYVEIATPGSWKVAPHLLGDAEAIGQVWTLATVATVGEDNLATVGVNEAVGEGAISRFTFTATELSEMIGGTDGNDHILGGDGNDTIYGDAGDDMIDGGTGDNFLYGGAGNDIISSTDGVDFIQGNEGNDDIRGGEGIDSLFGGTGNDVIRGGGSSDEISGGAGDDVLFGDAGADTITGGLGNDTISGGAGDDFIQGDGGNDMIAGGAGEDKMFGGDGDDIFVQSDGDVGLGHTLDGGAGLDTADYSAARGFVQLNLSNNKSAILPPGPVVTQPDVFVSIEKVVGSNFNDVIIGNNPLLAGTGLVNIIAGGKGGDKMTGSIGNDRYEFMQGDSTAVDFVDLGTVGLNDGDFFDFTLALDGNPSTNTIPTQIAERVDNIATQVGAITTYTAFGVGADTDTVWLHNGLGTSLAFTTPTGTGEVANQSYFAVRGNLVGPQFNVALTSGVDTLVVYDGDATAGVLQTALVLSGTGGAGFSFLDTNATANSLGTTFIL